MNPHSTWKLFECDGRYAQYLESKADLDGASREYKKAASFRPVWSFRSPTDPPIPRFRKAGDWLSLCRVACFNEALHPWL